jgi:Fur family transcriptional regulator, ferric uptake regulator
MPDTAHVSRPQPGEVLVRAGLHRTSAALAVLDVLSLEPLRSMTHADIEAALHERGLAPNRVTIYRLLERMVERGVLEKHADHADRTWRFGLHPEDSDTAQARFECDACHRHFQLPEASEPTKAVADQIMGALSSLGHHGQRVDLSIHGLCAGCVEPGATP